MSLTLELNKNSILLASFKINDFSSMSPSVQNYWFKALDVLYGYGTMAIYDDSNAMIQVINLCEKYLKLVVFL